MKYSFYSNISKLLNIFKNYSQICFFFRNKTRDPKTSEIISLSSHCKAGQIQYIESTGFFTRRMVNNIYSAIKKYMSEEVIPWCSMDVQGFADSPVSWGLKEHNFYTDGDNSYTIVFRSGGNFITRKSLSSNNKPRIFQ